MSRKIAFLLLILLTLAVNIAAQEKYVRFVDEAGKDKSFNLFRAQLITAVKKHDTKFLLSVLDPQIKNSFGGGDGIQGFKEKWQPNNRATRLWEEMSAILTNGGSFMDKNRRTFGAPYSYTQFPETIDAFEHAVILGKSVKLYKLANPTSPVIATLSYNLVKPDYENSVADKSNDGQYLWVKVETLGGKKGYVRGESVRSPIDYRIIFQKKKGKWKITAFIAGD